MRKQALTPQIKRSERQAKRCAQGKLYLSFLIKTLRSRCQADTAVTAGFLYVKYELYIPNVHDRIAFYPPFPFVPSVWPFLQQSLRCPTRDAICTLCCFVAWRPCN